MKLLLNLVVGAMAPQPRALDSLEWNKRATQHIAAADGDIEPH